jgi:topoisomerase IA-like protein
MLKNLKNWLGLNSAQSQIEIMLEEINSPAKKVAKKAPAKKVAKKAPAKKVAKKAPAKKVAKKAPAKKTSGGGKGSAAL